MSKVDVMRELARVGEVSPSAAERAQMLWAMSAEQRVGAMRRGELTLSQCLEWARRAPEEVPLLEGEFEFIAGATPEVADAR